MQIFTIPGKNFDSNVYLLPGKIPTIIDAGTGVYSKDLIKTIGTILEPSLIKQIVLTHEHFDHVGGSLDILKATNNTAKIYSHKNAVDRLKTGKSSFAQMLGCSMPEIHNILPVSDTDRLLCGNELLTILHTPGHSLGSICLYNQKEKVLFSGDTIFANGDFGRYDLNGGDFQSLVTSLKRLTTYDIAHLYPGHGPIVENNAQQHVTKSYQNIQSMI
ncbi:MAG: MBL fold metallo-hydrolase [Thermoplasmatota archaeon]